MFPLSVLHYLKVYADILKDVEKSLKGLAWYVTCNTTITFTNDALMLGFKPHNCLLFVTSYIREQKLKRILVEGGSPVNIIPKSMMNELGDHDGRAS